MDANTFFDRLWEDYTTSTPQARVIRNAFVERGDKVVNDHVAFRTLALEPIGLERLEPHLLRIGYKRFAPYEFPEKKLRAWGYTSDAPDAPRVFLSELLVGELSEAAAAILMRCAEQVDSKRIASPEVFWSGRLWPAVSFAEYETLRSESEYAAWMSTMGIRPNHFTISVNHLGSCGGVEDVLKVVEGLGYGVNDSGGRVKGSPEQLLEQGSTLADKAATGFSDGSTHETPTCYYEFAKRYPDASGELFEGFVATSASRIFESTDAKP